MSIAAFGLMASPRSILVPIDGSLASSAALDHAVALAEETSDTKVDALHVEAPEQFEFGSSVALAPEAREEANRNMKEAMERAQARLGDRVSLRKVAGDPLRTIIELAGEGGYELIIMGTHGRVGRLQVMLGSVASGVVRNAPCPVLTVRESSDSYQSFADRLHHRPSLAEQARHHT